MTDSAKPASPDVPETPGADDPHVGFVKLLSQQEALRQVIEETSSELELEPLLTNIVRRACELLDANDGSIGLYDAERDRIRIAAAHRMPDGEVGSEMAPGEGLAGQVLLRRAPVVLERYGSVPNPARLELKENAVLGVPIFWRQALVGFFGIGARPPRRFDRSDVNVLTLFARHAGIAIDNAARFARERERVERLGLLARVTRIIARGLRLETLLDDAADAVHRLLGYPNVAIPVLDPEDPSTLVLRAVGGGYRTLIDREYRLPVQQGIMGAAVRAAETVLVNDVEGDPRYVPTPGATGIRAELAVPILLGGDVLGVLNVESGQAFTDEDTAALEIIADHLAVAIKNAALFAQAHRLAVVEERQRLARELHDSVTQMLFSATLIAQAVPQAYRSDPAEGERRLTRLLELNRSALGEMRALLRELRPADDDTPDTMPMASGEFPLPTIFRVRRDGLVPVLDEVLAEAESDGLGVTRRWQRYRRQSADLEENLFRIAQEALNNITKHAEARHVTVRLTGGDDQVTLVVEDDGLGFDARETLAAPSQDGGFGVRSMRERARALNGRFRLVSSPGHGTRIETHLPARPASRTDEERT